MGMSRLSRLDGRCGAVVMGYPCEQARGYPITTAPPPTGVQACPCRKSLHVKLPFGHKIEHTAKFVHNLSTAGFVCSIGFVLYRFWRALTVLCSIGFRVLYRFCTLSVLESPIGFVCSKHIGCSILCEAILREAIFVMDRVDTKGVVLWHWGGAGELARQRPTPVPQNHSSLRSGSLDMTIFLKIFSSCLSCPSWKKTHGSLRVFSCPSWIKDMLCCPRETSPRSFHSPRSIPQVAHVRGGLLRCATTPVRRPGVIHGVTPLGSVLTLNHHGVPLGSVLILSHHGVPSGSVLTLSPEADRYPSDTYWWSRRF